MKRHLCLLFVAIFLLLPVRGYAQGYAAADRFELGQRLRAFEGAWDEQTDADARRRAVPFLNKATEAFLFTPRVGEIGKELDKARFALRSPKEPDAATIWAASLSVKPASRLLDTKAADLSVTLSPFYQVEAERFADVRLQLTICRADRRALTPATEAAIAKVPLDIALPLRGFPEGDYTVRAEIIHGKRMLAYSEQTLSLVEGLSERLERLEKAVQVLPEKPASTDTETARALAKLLVSLRQGGTLETDYPATRLLAEAEAAIAAIAAGNKHYGEARAGQYWVTLATAKGPVPARMLAPEPVKAGNPLPLVIALHGAGGSENMFFDGYGRGAIVRLCQERGWLLVAPRGNLLGGPPLREVVEEVSRLYPVDRKRVLLVGHSLGAIQALSAAQRSPESFAALAALAGGIPVDPSEGLKKLPFFIGVGSEDPILRGSSRRLSEGLHDAGVKTVVFQEYPDVEHLVVVGAALKDVFAFFDGLK